MNSFVTSGGVLYYSYEGERTILRGKAVLFAGGNFLMLPAMSPMLGWLVVHYPYQRMARRKRRICFGRDICLVRGGKCVIFIE